MGRRNQRRKGSASSSWQGSSLAWCKRPWLQAYCRQSPGDTGPRRWCHLDNSFLDCRPSSALCSHTHCRQGSWSDWSILLGRKFHSNRQVVTKCCCSTIRPGTALLWWSWEGSSTSGCMRPLWREWCTRSPQDTRPTRWNLTRSSRPDYIARWQMNSDNSFQQDRRNREHPTTQCMLSRQTALDTCCTLSTTLRWW